MEFFWWIKSKIKIYQHIVLCATKTNGCIDSREILSMQTVPHWHEWKDCFTPFSFIFREKTHIQNNQVSFIVLFVVKSGGHFTLLNWIIIFYKYHLWFQFPFSIVFSIFYSLTQSSEWHSRTCHTRKSNRKPLFYDIVNCAHISSQVKS